MELKIDRTNLPENDFEPLPEGEYQAQIIEVEKKETKSGTGSYLKITYVITEGQYRNRRLYMNLNLWNPNEKTVQIANGQLKKMCDAMGLDFEKVNDTNQLIGIDHVISVVVRPAVGQYQASNDVKRWLPFDNKPATSTVAAPPWARK